MSDKHKKVDKRITRTHLALKDSMFFLLNQKNFGKITVNELCEKAFIGRATFYSNFKDKYDLLEFCFDEIKKDFELYVLNHTDKQVIARINEHLYANAKIVKNLVDQANAELMNLLKTLLSPNLTKNLSAIEKDSNTMTDSHIALLHFCAGGMANLLIWQIENNFPVEKDIMTEYLYQLQKGIEKWDLNQI